MSKENPNELKIINKNERLKYLNLIAEKNKRIAELKEQLKNAIVPKFKIGQEVWWIYKDDIIESYVISDIRFMCFGDDGYWLEDKELFSTKEEAEAKLK